MDDLFSTACHFESEENYHGPVIECQPGITKDKFRWLPNNYQYLYVTDSKVKSKKFVKVKNSKILYNWMVTMYNNRGRRDKAEKTIYFAFGAYRSSDEIWDMTAYNKEKREETKCEKIAIQDIKINIRGASVLTKEGSNNDEVYRTSKNPIALVTMKKSMVTIKTLVDMVKREYAVSPKEDDDAEYSDTLQVAIKGQTLVSPFELPVNKRERLQKLRQKDT